MLAFDADVLIYAASEGHPLGEKVAVLFHDVEAGHPVGIGSVLLLTETLAKPLRDDPASVEVAALAGLLARLDLLPLDEPTARLTLVLAVAYKLRAADAAHLATAVAAGADGFVTNNRKDFPVSIREIQIICPEDL